MQIVAVIVMMHVIMDLVSMVLWTMGKKILTAVVLAIELVTIVSRAVNLTVLDFASVPDK
jgi:hypothetical protein